MSSILFIVHKQRRHACGHSMHVLLDQTGTVVEKSRSDFAHASFYRV